MSPQEVQHHDHAGTAAVWAIIHSIMTIGGHVAWIAKLEADKSRSPGPTEQRRIKRRREPFRKQRNDIYLHGTPTSPARDGTEGPLSPAGSVTKQNSPETSPPYLKKSGYGGVRSPTKSSDYFPSNVLTVSAT